MEYELYDEVGEMNNICGGDIFLDPVKIIWEAHCNIERNREMGTPNNGRLLDNQVIIDELFEQMKKSIV